MSLGYLSKYVKISSIIIGGTDSISILDVKKPMCRRNDRKSTTVVKEGVTYRPHRWQAVLEVQGEEQRGEVHRVT